MFSTTAIRSGFDASGRVAATAAQPMEGGDPQARLADSGRRASVASQSWSVVA
jgi:hypothetical protein